MFKKQTFLPLALFLFFCALFTVTTPLTAVSQEQKGNEASSIPTVVKNKINIEDLRVIKEDKSTTVIFVANTSISDYTVKKLPGTETLPPRMYIDIANVQATSLPQSQDIDTSVSEIRTSPRGTGVRIVFNSANPELFGYTVQPVAQGLQVTINEAEEATSSGDSTLDALINTTAQASDAPTTVASPIQENESSVASTFAGFNREHISVDFYKIDLHNVFRLLREISGQNIIVDESVSGSLTLALTDVPWDFALDVILNLKELEKEEQFNTIVIYPKSKTFEWPAEAIGSLSIEEAPLILAQEELIIEKASQQPEEVLLAKEIITKARRAEKSENFNKATELYIQAFALWPQNSQIATRIATLYLVNLGMNAKATFYAKEALNADPGNIRAALYAAIGSANMGRIEEASEYFHQSISGTPPLREALVSFAAFSENNGNNKAALTLLTKLHTYYGETITTMISKARLYDKTGNHTEAIKQYKAILASGFQIRPNLREYINERVN